MDVMIYMLKASESKLKASSKRPRQTPFSLEEGLAFSSPCVEKVWCESCQGPKCLRYQKILKQIFDIQNTIRISIGIDQVYMN